MHSVHCAVQWTEALLTLWFNRIAIGLASGFNGGTDLILGTADGILALLHPCINLASEFLATVGDIVATFSGRLPDCVTCLAARFWGIQNAYQRA